MSLVTSSVHKVLRPGQKLQVSIAVATVVGHPRLLIREGEVPHFKIEHILRRNAVNHANNIHVEWFLKFREISIEIVFLIS